MMHCLFRTLFTVHTILLFAGCSAQRYAGSASDQVYAHRVQDPAGWALVLPGASGLTIFEDTEHYARAATRLNEAGLDVWTVDYKGYWALSENRPGGLKTHEKIAWVIGQVLDEIRLSHDLSGPGFLLGWSMGCGGIWEICSDPGRVEAYGVDGAIAYYPVLPEQEMDPLAAPVMIFQGTADDVTDPDDLRAWATRPAADPIEILWLNGAMHGFDITSLQEPVTVRLLGFLGPSATLGYNAAAAEVAQHKEAAFISQVIESQANEPVPDR